MADGEVEEQGVRLHWISHAFHSFRRERILETIKLLMVQMGKPRLGWVRDNRVKVKASWGQTQS